MRAVEVGEERGAGRRCGARERACTGECAWKWSSAPSIRSVCSDATVYHVACCTPFSTRNRPSGSGSAVGCGPQIEVKTVPIGMAVRRMRAAITT